MLFGYARVSTKDQNLHMQLMHLRNMEWKKKYLLRKITGTIKQWYTAAKIL